MACNGCSKPRRKTCRGFILHIEICAWLGINQNSDTATLLFIAHWNRWEMLGFLLAVSGLNGENIDIDHEFHFQNFYVEIIL